MKKYVFVYIYEMLICRDENINKIPRKKSHFRHECYCVRYSQYPFDTEDKKLMKQLDSDPSQFGGSNCSPESYPTLEDIARRIIHDTMEKKGRIYLPPKLHLEFWEGPTLLEEALKEGYIRYSKVPEKDFQYKLGFLLQDGKLLNEYINEAVISDTILEIKDTILEMIDKFDEE